MEPVSKLFFLKLLDLPIVFALFVLIFLKLSFTNYNL
jgi:hypothetical protein